jgi:hypothetical protein
VLFSFCEFLEPGEISCDQGFFFSPGPPLDLKFAYSGVMNAIVLFAQYECCWRVARRSSSTLARKMLLNSARDHSCRAKIEVLRTKPEDVKPCRHILAGPSTPLGSLRSLGVCSGPFRHMIGESDKRGVALSEPRRKRKPHRR